MEDYKTLYEQRLERAKEEIKKCGDNTGRIRMIENIFPELRESEDERIRKGIIRNLEYLMDRAEGFVKEELQQRIAWLKKQGDIEYVFRPLAGCDIYSASESAVERQKSGKKIILAFNGAYIPVDRKTTDEIVNEYYSWLEKQGNKLHEEKVDEAMREIEEKVRAFSNKHKGESSDEILAQMRGEQKPIEWNADDLLKRNQIITILKEYNRTDLIAWLEKIEIIWLKSLKERVQPQPKQEWSEEDETACSNTIIMIKEGAANHYMKDSINLVITWLKSLKERYSWKPSDEQMKALVHVINLMASSESPMENDYYYNVLKDMRTQLKKLREE